MTGFLRPAGSKRAELERPLTAYGLQESDTLKVERVTDRTRETGSRLTSGRVCSRSGESKQASLSSRSIADFKAQDSKVVEEVTPTVSGKLSAVSKILKWIFWIIIGLIGLIVTAKICHRR